MERQRSGDRGGILGLADLLDDEDSAGAINFDLLTLAGLTLDDLGVGLSWYDLLTFIEHLPGTSAYVALVDPNAVYRTPENMLRILTADGARNSNDRLFNLFINSANPGPKPADNTGEPKGAKVTDIRGELARRKANFAAAQQGSNGVA